MIVTFNNTTDRSIKGVAMSDERGDAFKEHLDFPLLQNLVATFVFYSVRFQGQLFNLMSAGPTFATP
jgi:hypothetical protein